MVHLHWEMSVLSRAVAYNNLSGAALHVGLSQPQLSRIVARLEKELGVVLLDRGARRKSSWTPSAFKLAELYSGSSKKLEIEIQRLVGNSEPAHLKIGTLEGLIPVATEYCNQIMLTHPVKVLELNSFDLNRLEELFMSGELDVIFSSREPGKKKFKLAKLLGYQSLEVVSKTKGVNILSSFEYGTQMNHLHPTEKEKILVSNSLEARRYWVEHFGGTATLPSPVRKTRGPKKDHEVMMICSDLISPLLTKKLLEMK
jgi:hypothetical protein